MWCSKDTASAQITRRSLLLGALAMSGCDFRPLYGARGGGAPAASLFGQVRVRTGADELGFRLREALVRRLSPARPEASLTLVTTESVVSSGLAIEQDDSITRYNLRLTVAYRLLDGAGEQLTAGSVETIAAYNAVASQYQSLVSEREVSARAGEDAADKIVRRLAADFDPAWLQ